MLAIASRVPDRFLGKLGPSRSSVFLFFRLARVIRPNSVQSRLGRHGNMLSQHSLRNRIQISKTGKLVWGYSSRDLALAVTSLTQSSCGMRRSEGHSRPSCIMRSDFEGPSFCFPEPLRVDENEDPTGVKGYIAQ